MRVLITYEQDASAEIADPTADCVWAIDTPANRGAAESRWGADSYKGFEVTVFNEQELSELLPTVLEHHPDCETLEVRNAKAGRDVWEELDRLHFVPLRQSPGVLRAGRRKRAV
jgi:hypothetical protein